MPAKSKIYLRSKKNSRISIAVVAFIAILFIYMTDYIRTSDSLDNLFMVAIVVIFCFGIILVGKNRMFYSTLSARDECLIIQNKFLGIRLRSRLYKFDEVETLDQFQDDDRYFHVVLKMKKGQEIELDKFPVLKQAEKLEKKVKSLLKT